VAYFYWATLYIELFLIFNSQTFSAQFTQGGLVVFCDHVELIDGDPVKFSKNDRYINIHGACTGMSIHTFSRFL